LTAALSFFPDPSTTTLNSCPGDGLALSAGLLAVVALVMVAFFCAALVACCCLCVGAVV